MLPDDFPPVPMPVHANCGKITSVLSRIGDKWSVLIVMILANGPCRFNELKRTIGGISQRMLTLNLRGLERDGLLSRTVHATNPPSVEYALTPLGRSLCQPVMGLGNWAMTHMDRIERARAEFDARDRSD